jgi:Tfp pilus assembly protein PilP
MKLKSLLFLTAGIMFMTSCEKDDVSAPVEKGDYTNGIFVLNEGNFGSGNSSVTFVDQDLTSSTNNIYKNLNGGASLGDTAQDLAFYGDYAYIVLNVSNTIEVVDRNTFEAVATIDSELNNPRNIAFQEDLAYVTNWGDPSNPDDDYVAVYQTEDFSFINSIAVAEGPEAIVSEAGKLYVAHMGGYNFNNKISVIDVSDNSVEIVQVGDVPNSIEVENGYLWVLSGGKPAYAEEETAGQITQIDLASLEVVDRYLLKDKSQHPDHLEIDGNNIYYTIGNNVYTFEKGAARLPEQELFAAEEVTALYGFAVRDGNIYITSATADFTGDGMLYVYDASTGSLLSELGTGINPNGVYFN